MRELMERLGHGFKDEEVLAQALNRDGAAWQRLEFLGDRALGLAVGAWVFEKFPEADEGALSRRLTAMVRTSALAQLARELGVEDALVLARGEKMSEAVAADGLEAVLGAVFADGGLGAVEMVVRKAWAGMVDAPDVKDAKTRLQEWLQGQGLALPLYEVVTEEGPDHDKAFEVEVRCARGKASGRGRTKQAAGLMAAETLMAELEKAL